MEDSSAFEFSIGAATDVFVSDLPMLIEELTGIDLPAGINASGGIGVSGGINFSIDADAAEEDPILGIAADSLNLVGELLEDPKSLDADSVLGSIGNSFGDLIFPAVNTVAGDVVGGVATEILEDSLGPIVAPLVGGVIGGVAGNIAEDIVEDVFNPTDDGMDTGLTSAIEPLTGFVGLFF